MTSPRTLWAIPALLSLTAFIHAADTAPPVPEAGNHEYSLKHDGRERTYLLHIPPKYEGATPLPLVMFFHGGMGTAEHGEKSYGWSEKADAEGFLVVYANGTGRTWNAIHGCGPAHKNNVDDLGFVKAMLQDLNAKVKIDAKRIYATGMSNGAMFSYRLAAEMADTFAAVAPVAGAIGGKENAGATEKRIPAPANPVAIIIFHGKEDQHVPYGGGQTQAGVERNRFDLSVKDAVAFWVRANGCDAMAKKEEMANGSVIKESYAGAAADVVLYSMVHGGHSWPGGKKMPRKVRAQPTETISATDLAWEFFKQHPKK